jgi:tetratricopeptide (TPR) repeat protein
VDPEAAERHLRRALRRAVKRKDHRIATGIANGLANFLILRGRLSEALDIAERAADLTRLAGLGPWTQLADEGQRLHILSQLGDPAGVLAEVERLRSRMAALPERSGPDEIQPWNVRESLLDIGRGAAAELGRWQLALDLSDEARASMAARHVGRHDLALVQVKDYLPLLRLNRLPAADRLLQSCQQVFEDAADTAALGTVFAARADLESELGRRDRAVDLSRVCLRYAYQGMQLDDVVNRHHGLCRHLVEAAADPAEQVAHAAAAAVLASGTTTGRSDKAVALLAHVLRRADPAATPASFAALRDRLEQADGVRFGRLWATLAPEPGAGDDALAEVLRAAREVPDDEAVDLQAYLDRWEPSIAAIVGAVRNGVAAITTVVHVPAEPGGPLETSALTGALQRVLAGERAEEALVAGLGPADAAVVRRTLAALAAPAGSVPPGSAGPAGGRGSGRGAGAAVERDA